MMSKVFMDGADPIIIEDLDGNIIDANDEAITSYGWKRVELLGKPAVSLVPQDGHTHFLKIQEQCPTLLIYDSEGNQIYFHEGFRPGDEITIEKHISQYLDSKND